MLLFGISERLSELVVTRVSHVMTESTSEIVNETVGGVVLSSTEIELIAEIVGASFTATTLVAKVVVACCWPSVTVTVMLAIPF